MNRPSNRPRRRRRNNRIDYDDETENEDECLRFMVPMQAPKRNKAFHEPAPSSSSSFSSSSSSSNIRMDSDDESIESEDDSGPLTESARGRAQSKTLARQFSGRRRKHPGGPSGFKRAELDDNR